MPVSRRNDKPTASRHTGTLLLAAKPLTACEAYQILREIALVQLGEKLSHSLDSLANRHKNRKN